MSRRGYETSSGNVFKDLRVPNAEEHLVKAQLVFKIDTIVKERQLKQVEAAQLFGVRQPDVSKMLSGKIGHHLDRGCPLLGRGRRYARSGIRGRRHTVRSLPCMRMMPTRQDGFPGRSTKPCCASLWRGRTPPWR